MNPKHRNILKHRFYISGDRNDFSGQTESELNCFLCHLKWNNSYELYSHILTQCHKQNNYFTCVVCKFKLNRFSPESHDCFRNKCIYISHMCKNKIKYGLPLICLLCKGRRFQSKVYLFVHLLCYHSKEENYMKKCGLCSYRIKSIRKSKKSVEYSNELPFYNKDFDKHIYDNHIFGYEISYLNQLNLDNERRLPYSCVCCSDSFDSNDQFQAHIISRHSLKHEYDSATFVCYLCKIPYWSEKSFKTHVNTVHTSQFRSLAIKLSNSGYIDNYVDLNSICIICWSRFECNRMLQIHLIMFHTYFSQKLSCGLCNFDIDGFSNLKTLHKYLEEHQNSHFQILKSDVIDIKRIFTRPDLSIYLNKDNRTLPELLNKND